MLPVVVADGKPRLPILITCVIFGLLAKSANSLPPVDHTIFIEPCVEFEVTIDAPVSLNVLVAPEPVVVSANLAFVSKFEFM